MTTFLRTAPLLLVALSAAADGDTRFHADLVGTQEVPAIFTAGSATLDMRVLDNDTRIEFQLAYENLTAPPLAAHVHFGQRGVSGGVSFFFCGGGGKPPCAGGHASGTVTAANVVGPTTQGIAVGELNKIIAAMRAGVAYANIHTATFPGGEIRGQINFGANNTDQGERGND